MYLTQGLLRAAQIRPHCESTVFRDRRWSWAQTLQRVAQIAGGLAEAGLRPGERVAVLALNSDRYFELFYAIPWLGAVIVPINTRLATPEVQYIVADSGARVLVIDGAMASHANALVDANRNEVPRGTVGELAARGPMIMLGYWNKPDETAAVLEDGWYYSGDAAYMDDEGFLFIVDRLKDMIISGGENIHTAEVESAISLLPGVAEVAVIGVPDAKWGETVHAVIVRHSDAEGADLQAEAVIAHCRTQIAGYKCPRSIEFRDTPLPVSGAGKVLKRELRDPSKAFSA